MLEESIHTCSFVSLAETNMSDKTLCIAGIDPETNDWIRPVEPGYHCLFEKHLAWFPNNTLIKAEFSRRQLRSKKDDPYDLHREDMPIAAQPAVVSGLTRPQKLQILKRATDQDLLSSIGSSKRSMFLIRIHDFKLFLSPSDIRIAYFAGGGTDSDSLTHYLNQDLQFVGISRNGIPCRMRSCSEFISIPSGWIPRPLGRSVHNAS